MARILFAWELGAGAGHLAPMVGPIEHLMAEGHEVFVAARNLHRAGTVFRGLNVRSLQSPYRDQNVNMTRAPVSVAHLLEDASAGNRLELESLVGAWSELLEWVKPSLVIADHAPTGLIAARTMGVRVVTVGSAFCCPPGIKPLPFLIPPLLVGQVNSETLIRDEERVLGNVNAVIEGRKGPRLDYLGALFAETADSIIYSYPELDHFGKLGESRSGGIFAGIWPTGFGSDPKYPAGEVKVLVYLDWDAGTEAIIEFIASMGFSAIVLGQGWEGVRAKYVGSTISISTEPVNVDRALKQCSFVISSANNSLTCTALRAGRPLLIVPNFMEQYMLAQRVEQLGAGLNIRLRDGNLELGLIHRFVGTASYWERAREFAARHQEDSLGLMIGRVERLLG